MQRRPVVLSMLLGSLSGFLFAGPIVYTVTIDTSSISRTTGAFDLNFNPGPLVTQSASLQILNFTSNGTLLGHPAFTGDISGALPGTLTFNNGTGFNDYFEKFTFGSALLFDIDLSGPALSSPDRISNSGSTFALSIFSDASGTVPALTDDTTDGFAFIVDVNLDGTTTVMNWSPESDVTQLGSGATPEPTSFGAVAFGIVLLAIKRFALQRSISHHREKRCLAI